MTSILLTSSDDHNDQYSLQEDIDLLVKWSSDWRMLFNFEK